MGGSNIAGSACQSRGRELGSRRPVIHFRAEFHAGVLREHLPFVKDRLIGIVSRGGSLLALTFSSLPLWKGFDPLAILAMTSLERKRRKEELEAEEQAEDRGVARLFDDR